MHRDARCGLDTQRRFGLTQRCPRPLCAAIPSDRLPARRSAVHRSQSTVHSGALLCTTSAAAQTSGESGPQTRPHAVHLQLHTPWHPASAYENGRRAPRSLRHTTRSCAGDLASTQSELQAGQRAPAPRVARAILNSPSSIRVCHLSPTVPLSAAASDAAADSSDCDCARSPLSE